MSVCACVSVCGMNACVSAKEAFHCSPSALNRELCDRDEINEYLRGEVRVLHMKFKVR